MPYPEYCLKGIKAKDCISDDGEIEAHLFEFKKRNDSEDWRQSVNWQDDDLAIEFTLRQTKPDGTLLFKHGIVSVSRREIDRINSRPSINGVLSYERDQLPDNPYHGHLVLEARIPKRKMWKIAAILIIAREELIPQDPTL